MKTCVIFNPAARGDKARRLREALAGLARDAELEPTTGPGAGRALAAKAVRDGFGTIVAAGGDGTLNEVLNGIGDVEGGFARTRLGILPLGTANVFASELGLPDDTASAWRVVLAGRERAIDLAAADFVERGAAARRYLAQLAGAGWDARAVEGVDWELKKRWGRLAYVIAGLRAMRGPLPRIEVVVGGAVAAGQLVLVGNGRFYGGRHLLFPDARLDDGLLDVTVLAEVDWALLSRAGWDLLTGRPPAGGQAVRLRGATVRLTSSEVVPFQIDGEAAGSLPVTFSARPGALRVLVP